MDNTEQKIELVDLNQHEKLTDWTNPPKLADLKQQLEDAKPIHDTQVSKITTWTDLLNVTGSAKLKLPKRSSQVQPKLIRQQAEWRYPALSEPFLSTSDIFNVAPISGEDREGARQNQMLLNYQFNTKVGKVKFIDEYIRTLVNEGTAILKTGWKLEEETYEEEEPIYSLVQDDSFGPTIEEIAALRAASLSRYQQEVPEELQQAYEASMEHQVPYRPEITGSRTVTKTRTLKNHPTVEVCTFQNTIIDPTAKGNMEEANFVIHSYTTNLSELKKDKRYKNLEHINIANNSPLSAPDHVTPAELSGFAFRDKPRAKMVVHEYWGYWDINGTGIVQSILVCWIGDTIIRMETNPFPDKKLPFVIAQYRPIVKSNYGEPDAELLEDNQKILGAVTRGMIDLLAKSANSQTAIPKGALDVVNRRKYENGEDYEYNPQNSPDSIYMHKFPEIPQSALVVSQMQYQQAESLTGVKSFSGGVTGNSLGDVAAGVRGALDASSKRETAILRRAAEGIIQVARKFTAMNAEWLSEEEVIRVTDEEFVTIRRDDLAGEYDYSLSISTAEEDDRKGQELAFVLQTIGPDEDPTIRRTLLAEICRLRKMPDLAKKIEEYEPQPDPVQQMLQKLEIAKIQAEIAKLEAETAETYAKAGLAQVKQGSEQIKAAENKAELDQKNLNFVEQESGVHQERELQKIRAQGEEKRLHEVVKAAVAPKKETTKK